MKRSLAFVISLYTLAIFVAGWPFSQAQGRGPVIDILGKPETAPPDARAYVSVVDPSTGRVIDGLSEVNFAVQVSEQDVQASVSLETRGMAVVMVIDRGGIGRRGDPRIGDAVGLAESLLGLLNVDGSASADMVALIGIRGRDDGGLTPLVPFTDWDPNSVGNTFNALRTEVVAGVTPLYDGIDQAIEWIAANPNAEIQQKLAHRRPVIVVFSDGIDNQFSDKAHEAIITTKCREHSILLYAVRMEARGRTTDEDNLETLASQTNGIYITHNKDTHDQVLNLFASIATQRQAYQVVFPLHRPQGDYEVRVQALDTPIGDGSDVAMVSSRLRLPVITLASPADGVSYTVTYSHTPQVEIPLSVELAFPDGIERQPTQVQYFHDSALIATSTAAPSFATSWDVTGIITQTEETRETQERKYRDLTFTAAAEDAYLDQTVTSGPVNIRVEWDPLPPLTWLEKLARWFGAYWWLLIILAALAVGLLVLLILLFRMRGELAHRLASRTTGVLKGVTKKLAAMPQRAPGKLVIVQGANMGKEFRLGAQLVRVGRDPQFCDLALYDDFVSNPHFSIALEQTQFYITDEGSTNGTRVNGAPLPPKQRMLLQPDAIIEVGTTRLQFKRLGGTTRQLGAGGQPGQAVHPGTPPYQPPPQSQQPVGGAGWQPTPPQASQPGASGWQPTPPQGSPPGPGKGGPTQRVP